MRLLFLLLMSGCVVRTIARPTGTQSFTVSVIKPEDPNALGTFAAPLPYAASTKPFQIAFELQAIGWNGEPDTSYNGRVYIDARPGLVFPNELNITNGVGKVSVRLTNSYGETRIWFEDCGARTEPEKKNCSADELQAWTPQCIARFQPGTLATGVSPAIIFAQPSISQMQVTGDNASSPLMPTSGDRCAALADPRYVDTTNLNPRDIASLPDAQKIPAVGNTVTIAAGEMIVTAIDNSGFYLSDVSAAGVQAGFNSTYVFNFNYPDNLQVGDRITALTGTPAEFVGMTQLANPHWKKDPKGPNLARLPMPFNVPPAVYKNAISATGGNVYNDLDMEKLEGGLVCFDNLQVPSGAIDCDLNHDGGISRAPGSLEQACETNCYQNPECFEKFSFFAYNNWGATLTRITDSTVKIGMDWSVSFPGFRPNAYIAEPWKYDTRAKEGDAPQHIAVIGNLIHVLGSRPVWILQPRGKDDIRFGGTCP